MRGHQLYIYIRIIYIYTHIIYIYIHIYIYCINPKSKALNPEPSTWGMMRFKRKRRLSLSGPCDACDPKDLSDVAAGELEREAESESECDLLPFKFFSAAAAAARQISSACVDQPSVKRDLE
jgi:hypothetical protein